MKHRLTSVLLAFATFGVTALPMVAHAQKYPIRSISVIVPFPAGGPSDVVARIVTEHMGRTLGQQMVVENVAGAGGTLGTARVAAARPDGYTLLGVACRRAGAYAERQVRLRAGLRTDWPDGARTRRDRRAKGFSGKQPD